MKKILSIAIASLMLASLAACGAPKDSSSGTDATTTAAPAGTTAAGGEVKTLKFAAVETAYGVDIWKDVAAAFEKVVPGVKVEITMDKFVEDVIGPSMKSGDYPDVIHVGVGREKGLTETFIKDKNLTDLTDVLSMTVPGESATVKDKLIPGFTDTSITNPYGDGKTYLMPTFYGPCGLFYNAGLLKAKGWEVPKTWDEMWALGDKAKAEGIALFTYPHAGYFDAFLYGLMNVVGGPEFFTKATHYEEGIWQTPEATKVFEIIGKLASYTEKTTPANANDENFKKNQQLVLDNKAIFIPNGTWLPGEMADAPHAEGFEWGMTALPALTAGGDAYSYTFFEQVWSPKEAKNPELAKEFIAFLYSDEAAKIFATKGAIQPIKGMSDKLDGDNKLFYSIYDNGAKASMGAFATTAPVEGITVRGTFFNPIDSLVTGNKTVEQWVADMTKDSDLLRAALQ